LKRSRLRRFLGCLGDGDIWPSAETHLLAHTAWRQPQHPFSRALITLDKPQSLAACILASYEISHSHLGEDLESHG